MSQTMVEGLVGASTAVAREACRGLLAKPKTLAPWLFYDETGCELFEEITRLPEYYLTRTERGLFAAHADEIAGLAGLGGPITIVELGAGTATKTGIILAAALRRQPGVFYQPIDVAESALEEARHSLEGSLPGLTVLPQVANYTVELMKPRRSPGERVLAMYIGSSLGNFTPEEQTEVLWRLRGRLEVGDSLLLGTDLAPSAGKPVERLLAAYDDTAGVTAAFNLNVLTRLNRELGAGFDVSHFAHEARWNAAESRIEMHLRSLRRQRVRLMGMEVVWFEDGETIHTENSYKFSVARIRRLLAGVGFQVERGWQDRGGLFGVTLGRAV